MATSVVVVFAFWRRAASLARSVLIEYGTVYYLNLREGGGMKARVPGPEFEGVIA